MTTLMISGIQHYISEFDHIDSALSWQSVLQSVLNLKNLTLNWDGENSVPPSEELVESLLAYLLLLKDQGVLPAPARAMATAGGGIIIEWQDSDGIIELECDKPGMGELMFAPTDGETEFQTIDWRIQSVRIEPKLSAYRINSPTAESNLTSIYSAA